MYMYDTKLGDMEVEIDMPTEIRDASIVYGYTLKDFVELTEEELEYLNDKYRDDILQQALSVQHTEDSSSVKLTH